MLSLDRIGRNQITGLCPEEMDFVYNLPCENYNNDTIFNQCTGIPSNEDIDLTDDQLEEIAVIEKSMNKFQLILDVETFP